MNNFQKAIEFVMKWEGGYVNNPKDPGGETNFGISKASYPEEDIKNMTLTRAIEIYKRDYWDAYALDLTEFPMCIVLFDAYVQHRPSTVKRLCDASEGDWRRFIEQRRIYYLNLIQKNPALSVFKRGWLNRMVDLAKYIDVLLLKESV